MPASRQYKARDKVSRVLTRSVNVCLDENVHTTDAIKLNLLILVVTPIAHSGHVGAASIILLVT